jgi:hypothetical protein
VHAHHIDYRSAGGKDELPNLTGLCAAHHLRGVHTGRIRVRGQAPDRLQWELGPRRAGSDPPPRDDEESAAALTAGVATGTCRE